MGEQSIPEVDATEMTFKTNVVLIKYDASHPNKRIVKKTISK